MSHLGSFVECPVGLSAVLSATTQSNVQAKLTSDSAD